MWAADHAVSCEVIVQRAHVNKYRNKAKYYIDVKVNKEYLLQYYNNYTKQWVTHTHGLSVIYI